MSLRTAMRTAPAWATLVVCCVAQFMVVLDVTIVNVALPQMRQDLGLSVNSQQWVVNAYTLTFAGFLMLGGRAADLFGRRRIFMIGLVIFTVCSLVGGVAQSSGWLIGARAAQGLGGAVLAPATLSLLTSRFTDPHARRRALGAWATTAASGAAVGVLAGGVLTDLLDWRWVLFVNVPIGIAVLVLAMLSLSESRLNRTGQRLDVLGATTVTLGLAAVVYGIVGTDTNSWGSARTIGVLAAGAVLLAAFAVIETRIAGQPLVPFSIFKMRSLSVANGVAVTIGMALFGAYFFLSLYLQQVAGYSPLRAGLAFLPVGLSTFLGSLIGTRVVHHIGYRRQLLLGPALSAAGLIWMATTLQAGDAYLPHILGPLILFGLGVGLSFVPMTLAATHGMPPHQAGLASGLINTTRQVGGAVGLAVMATFASSVSRGHHPTGPQSVATALTAGYDRAFLIAGLALVVAVVLALALPSAAQQRANEQAVSEQPSQQPQARVTADALAED
ncbi:MFS transporter [Rugosimonospora acidiphila]|uniref:MFS transporter n=1 Tax=Rugosimonospora acidiphila TaxID=556531 RepID=A0ABP9RKB5_9ACTN